MSSSASRSSGSRACPCSGAVLGLLCLALRPALGEGNAIGAHQLPIDSIFFVENSTFPSEGYAVERLQHWLGKACGGSAPSVVAQQPAPGGRWLAVGHI
eukprot:SAG22_NODE_17862_length_297_cov_1.035354_1_plen_98_part_11